LIPGGAMRLLLPFALVLLPVGMAMIGCTGSKPSPPPGPADVTLSVPGMN